MMARTNRSRVLLISFGIAAASIAAGVVATQHSFCCKHCGLKFNSVLGLTTGICLRHPDGQSRRHELYEGGEKEAYVCRFCGRVDKEIRTLTAMPCIRHPKGEFKGHHEPSL